MYAVRRWSVRNASFLEWFYLKFQSLINALHPLWLWLGYERIEKPIVAVEKRVKGLLFDCKMCGNCVLSSTGMSCPMNCPKEIRNGPCGGVRSNGNCEIKPEMRCVWLEGYKGSQRMLGGDKIKLLQPALDRSQTGRSSWLREARLKHDTTTVGS
ncbi:MAG: hypothetical protein ACI8P9_002076 [Parasphingorhabdus sp.]|jgi:hypothetical protein